MLELLFCWVWLGQAQPGGSGVTLNLSKGYWVVILWSRIFVFSLSYNTLAFKQKYKVAKIRIYKEENYEKQPTTMHTYYFEKLEVWQNARAMVKEIYKTTTDFPNNEILIRLSK